MSDLPVLRRKIVPGSNILEELWTIVKMSTFPAYAGRLDNYTLSNHPPFWRNAKQPARLSNFSAFWWKIRQKSCPRFQYFGGTLDNWQAVHFSSICWKIGQLYLIQSFSILEEAWTACKFVWSSCILEEGWTTAPCPTLHHFGGMLNNLPGCPILLHFSGTLDNNLFLSSSILEEG